MKLVLNPDYSRLKDVIKELPFSFSTLGERIYKARNELRCFEYEGKKYVVKGYKVPHYINRIAYTFFRSGKAQRAYDYALRLRAMGVGTPEPVCYVDTYRGGLLYTSYFVSECCLYPRMMREFYDDEISGREHILKAFAAYTVRLHELGVWHLDYSPGNILFDDTEEGVKFSILDLNRMRFTRMTRTQCLKNFERMDCGEKVFRLLVGEYARLRGWDEEQSIAVAWKANRRFWSKRS